MTVKRYQIHSAERACRAVVVGRKQIDDRPAVLLDQTIFYPTSGGQLHDKGTLNDIAVVDVRLEGDDIWHLLDRPLEENEVDAVLDWPRRFDFMQQHTAFHLLAGSFQRLFGIETLSSHLGETESTIDIDASEVDAAQTGAVEDLANAIIWEDRPVKALTIDAAAAAQLEIRKAPTVRGDIRLIDIQDFDLDPCGGTHVGATGQVGLVKIIGRERIRKNLRFTFLAGRRAWRHYRASHQAVNEWTGVLTTDMAGLGAALHKLLAEQKALRKEVERLSQQAAEQQLAGICSDVRKSGVISTAFADVELEGLRNLAHLACSRQPGTYLFGGQGSRSHVVMCTTRQDIDLTPFFREAMERLGGKGGGSGQFLQGSAPLTEQLPACLEEIRRSILHTGANNY